MSKLSFQSALMTAAAIAGFAVGRSWPATPADDRAYYVEALETSLTVLRDNQKPTFSDNQPMHLMVEHASLGATPVKPKAAGGGGLKGQALRAQR
jgi:hypothetical protein